MSTPLPRSPGFWPVYAGLAALRLCARGPWSLLRSIGSLLGLMVYVASAERRRITHINLKLCFPERSEQERRQMARQCFRESGQSLMELAPIWFGPRDRIVNAAQVSGVEHLNAAQAQGRGVLLIGFHTNDLELGATAISSHLNKMAGMYRPHSNVVFERSMRLGRERHFPLIPRDDIRGAVRWLKNGGILWYAPDQDYGIAQAVFAPFFNHPAATITATTRLAKLSNAVVIPMTHVRQASGIAIDIHPPLPIPGDNELADATALNLFLEAYLRKHPTNYMWMHRRFKTQAEGQPSLYPDREVDKTRISVRRYEMYLKNGQDMGVVAGADKCVCISETHLFLVFKRAWWQPAPATISDLLQKLAQWQAQKIPAPTFSKKVRCSARAVDLVYLRFPAGKPLASSDLSEQEQQQKIADWQQHYPQMAGRHSGFWLGDDQQLYVIP